MEDRDRTGKFPTRLLSLLRLRPRWRLPQVILSRIPEEWMKQEPNFVLPKSVQPKNVNRPPREQQGLKIPVRITGDRIVRITGMTTVTITVVKTDQETDRTTETEGIKETIEMTEMTDIRDLVRTIRERGITTEDLKTGIALTTRMAREISVITAVMGTVTAAISIITAVREAMEGRTLDLSGMKSRVRVSLRIPRRLRMTSAERKKSAESVRRRIRDPRRISCMKRTKQL